MLFSYLVSYNQWQHVLGLTQFSQGKCNMWILGSVTLAYQCLRQFSPINVCIWVLEDCTLCCICWTPVFFVGCPGHLQQFNFSGRVKYRKPPRHPLFYCSCISFWLSHLALVCQSLKKQCSSCRWDGLGSAIYSPHLNPQLTGSCVLENWHITLQGAYCHP